VIVSVEHGFVFIKTRKTAGTSIEIALSRHVGRRGDVVTEITEEDERIRRATPGAHPPMGVRVPLRRRLRGAPARWRNHTPAAVAALHLPTWDRSRRWAVMRDPWDVAASTVRWRRHVTGDPDLTLDDVLATGWHPALNWEAITVADEPVVEVIRYDRLVPDLTARLAEVGIAFDGQLPRAKQLPSPRPTAALLTDAHVALVGRRCAAEVERFGWQPPTDEVTR
jgi:hypothetical protein